MKHASKPTSAFPPVPSSPVRHGRGRVQVVTLTSLPAGASWARSHLLEVAIETGLASRWMDQLQFTQFRVVVFLHNLNTNFTASNLWCII